MEMDLVPDPVPGMVPDLFPGDRALQNYVVRNTELIKVATASSLLQYCSIQIFSKISFLQFNLNFVSV
jgi:hypothetical protein